MPEAGGPTTQSGIFYQNSVAALYLGRLLDPRPTPHGQRVTGVRVEAPEDVDDIVVNYEGGSRLLIQAKETLAVSSAPWTKFWMSLKAQLAKSAAQADRFRLVAGNFSADLETLRELCDRSQGKDSASEWRDALAATHKSLLEKVRAAADVDEKSAFDLARRLTIEFSTLEYIETVGVRDFVPESNTKREGLFSALRDACGGAARVRGTFTAAPLLDRLASTHAIKVEGAPADGLASYYRAVIAKFQDIAVPGTNFHGPQSELLSILSVKTKPTDESADFDEESHGRTIRLQGEDIDLGLFPRSPPRKLLLEAGAGFGKTTTLKAMVVRLAEENVYIPAYILADNLSSHTSILDYLESKINTDYRISLDWSSFLKQGRGVIFIDGVDELSDQARTLVVALTEQFSALFPDAPIVVAARDRSALTLPATFTPCQIDRLGRPEREEFLKAYLTRRPEINADTALRALDSADDLSSLCSIPLFLALLVATLPRSGALPQSRSDLLERYLAIALAPQRHKLLSPPRLSTTQLRQAAEALALTALENHEIAVSEDLARRTLGDRFGQSLADDCIDDLLQCGLTIRRGVRIGFPIATVQEFLAGCALATSPAQDVSQWFANVARRPWAQAIQFAIERTQNIESALIVQLDNVDDIFHTCLRVIARSIANGAKASPEFRKSIYERLSRAWITGGWRLRRDARELLVDGLGVPPSPEFIDAAVERADDILAGQLILRFGDQESAKRALKAVLAKPDIRMLWGADWTDIIQMIGPEAVELLLERSKLTDDLSEEVIASALYHLRRASFVDWRALTERHDQPASVRTACLWGAGLQNSAEGRNAISAFMEDAGGKAVELGDLARFWSGFPSAYLNTTWWRDHLVQIVHGDHASEPVRRSIFREIVDVRHDREHGGIALIDELKRLISAPAQFPPLWEALVCLASHGDYEANKQALDQLAAGAGRAEAWVSILPYLSEEQRAYGVPLVRTFVEGTSEEGEILDELVTTIDLVVSGQRRGTDTRGPFRRGRARGRERAEVFNWAASYLAQQPDSRERSLLLAHVVEAGGEGQQDLAQHLEHLVSRGGTGERDDWNWVCTAMWALEERHHKLPPQMIFDLAEMFSEYPTHSFFSYVLKTEGESISNKVCDFFNKNNGRIRREIISGLEDVASNLGVFVRHTPEDGLMLEWVH